MARALRPSGLYVPVGLWLNTLACGSTRSAIGSTHSRWPVAQHVGGWDWLARGVAVSHSSAWLSSYEALRRALAWLSSYEALQSAACMLVAGDLLRGIPPGFSTHQGEACCSALYQGAVLCALNVSGRAQASAIQAREGVSSSPCVSSKSSGMPCKPREQRFCPAAAKVQPWCLRWCAWKRW